MGDIVEAQVSFLLVPLKQNRFKMIPTLRAVTLLDDSPLRVCFSFKIYRRCVTNYLLKLAMVAKNEKRLKNISTSAMTTVKRSVGYEDEDEEDNEVEQARKRCKLLSLDSDLPASMEGQCPTP